MTLQHTLLFLIGLLLTTAVAGNKCPDPGDLEPCTCWPATGPSGPTGEPPRIHCGGHFENVEQLKKVVDATGDHPFADLQISGCILSYFPAYALKEKSIRELHLENVYQVGLFDKVPEPNHKLTSIAITHSRIYRGLEWPLLKNLNNLTNLVVGGVPIRSLGKEFVENIPKSLTSLGLEGSKLSRLSDQVFATLIHLTNIGLTHGRITTLKRSMFPAAGNEIESLDFTGNKISELPDDIFSDMPKLQHISLKNNLLTTISEAVFNEVGGRSVETSLLENELKCDCKIRWIMTKGWGKLEANCHSPKQFKDKAVVGGITDNDLSYCDDVRR